MKKVVAALVVLAMILAMAPSVFAATESGGFMLEGGTPYEWTAEYTGTATLSGEPAVNIMVNNGSLGMGPNPSFDVVEGTTYTVQHFGEGFAWITWEIETAGGNVGGDTGATSGSINIEAYGNAEWTAPQDGYVQFTIDISGATLAIVNGYTPVGSGTDTVIAQVTAGTTYLVAPGFDVTVNSVVTWEYVDGNGGGSAVETVPSGGALALGDNNVALSYATMPMMAPSWTYTATENGSLTVTVTNINNNTVLGMPFGMGMYTLLVGNSDGMGSNTVTVEMTAGDSVLIAVLDTYDMTEVPAVINLSFAAGTPTAEKNPADYFDRDPSGNYVIGSLESPVDIFVGNDDICYAYTAATAGTITITPTVEGYTATNCWIKVNDGSLASYTEPVAVNAGDVVIINIWSGYEGIVSMIAGEGGGNGGGTSTERNPADYFDRDPNGNYIIGSLESPVDIFVGNDDIYYAYTAETAGNVNVTASVEGFAGTNCLISVNGGVWASAAEPVAVNAGDSVIINIWSGYEGTVSMGEGGNAGGGEGGGEGGGQQPEGIPSGSALALGDNNVSLTYATIPMMAPSWTYTATEGGYLTVTVSSINGNTMLGMPFGMGMYTLIVGDSDGQGANTVTTYLNANDTVNITVLDTMDMEAVPAVINLSFVAGAPIVEKDPADYFDRDPNGNYVIGSLESAVNIFVGNDDICYAYTAETAGTVTVTPTVDGYTATNCWIKVNDGALSSYVEPVAVNAGDVVIINIWNGYEGTVTMTAGEPSNPGGGSGGESGESVLVQSGTEQVTDVGAVEVYYTPNADGVLTVNISADPGFKFWVYNVATDASLTLPENGTSGEYTYNLEAGVTYRVYMIGYYNWGESAATITYDISFKAEELNLAPVDIDKSDVVLELGANTVDLLENTIVSLYEFVPAEPGIYTITVGDGVTMATYGFSAWNLIAEAQNGVIVHTATDAEQTILVGLTADTASVTVTIEKTGNYTPPAQTVYEDYVPTNTVVSDFTDPTDLVNIDVNKDQTVVLGTDGYYHLGTADGPIVYVNLNNEQFTLAVLYEAGAPITMRGTYVDENGVEQHYDFMDMITGLYYDYSRVNDYHPLNKDLMVSLKAYGTAQGWYNANTSSFASISGGEFKAESAWLASCYSTVSYVEPGSGTGTGTGTGTGPVTGDNSPLMLLFALMAVSAGGILVLASKKKYAR